MKNAREWNFVQGNLPWSTLWNRRGRMTYFSKRRFGQHAQHGKTGCRGPCPLVAWRGRLAACARGTAGAFREGCGALLLWWRASSLSPAKPRLCEAASLEAVGSRLTGESNKAPSSPCHFLPGPTPFPPTTLFVARLAPAIVLVAARDRGWVERPGLGFSTRQASWNLHWKSGRRRAEIVVVRQALVCKV